MISHDQWVIDNSPIQAEKLHALGLITYEWNSCEFSLKLLFACFVPGWDTAWAVGQEMGDVALSNAIRNLINLSKLDQPAKDKVRDVLDIYDINRLNRNQLTHFTASATRDGIEFWRIRGPVFAPKPIPSDLEDIRRVCEEIKAATIFIGGMANWFIARRYPKTALGSLDPNWQPEPLPETPPLPQRLWKPPLQDSRAPKPPPRPSQA